VYTDGKMLPPPPPDPKSTNFDFGLARSRAEGGVYSSLMMISGDCLEWPYEDIQDHDPNICVGCVQLCPKPSQIIGQQLVRHWLKNE